MMTNSERYEKALTKLPPLTGEQKRLVWLAAQITGTYILASAAGYATVEAFCLRRSERITARLGFDPMAW